jgi:hypothetical protein
MKTNYAKMLYGSVIGILGALVLTLNIWGNEWYKVVLATLIGIIIGLFIADYKAMIEIFRSVFKKISGMRNRELSEEQLNSWKVLKLFSFFISVQLAPFLLVLSTYVYLIFKIDPALVAFTIMSLGALAALFITYYLAKSFDFDMWAKNLDAKEVRDIWNKKPDSENGRNRLNYDYINNQYIGFFDLTVDMEFKEIIKKSLLTAKIVTIYRTKNLLKGIVSTLKVVGYWTLVSIIFIFTGLPLLPFFLIKEISKNGRLLTTASAIVTGALIGTFLSSYFYGVGSGLLFLASSYVLNKFINKIDIIYFFREGSMMYRMHETILS